MDVRLVNCPQCGQPQEHIGDVSASYTGSDPRLADFAERIAGHSPDAQWDVYECRNPACGCGCRRYIALSAAPVL